MNIIFAYLAASFLLVSSAFSQGNLSVEQINEKLKDTTYSKEDHKSPFLFLGAITIRKDKIETVFLGNSGIELKLESGEKIIVAINEKAHTSREVYLQLVNVINDERSRMMGVSPMLAMEIAASSMTEKDPVKKKFLQKMHLDSMTWKAIAQNFRIILVEG